MLCDQLLFETQVAIGLHDIVHRFFEQGKHDYITEAAAQRDFTLVSMKDDQLEDTPPDMQQMQVADAGLSLDGIVPIAH